MFDLGMMNKLGINGLEVNEQEASSLLMSAGNNSVGIRREIEAMDMDSENKHMARTLKRPKQERCPSQDKNIRGFVLWLA